MGALAPTSWALRFFAAGFVLTLWEVAHESMAPLRPMGGPARMHYFFSLAVALFAFGAIYWVMDRVFRLHYWARLATANGVLTIFGMALIVSPTIVVELSGSSTCCLPETTMFNALTAIATLGYVMSLLGLAAFVALLVHAVYLRMRLTRGAV
jgi:heme/copper-type cytochrome/quinol oxidase subunit 1